jgi:hypothetical protein
VPKAIELQPGNAQEGSKLPQQELQLADPRSRRGDYVVQRGHFSLPPLSAAPRKSEMQVGEVVVRLVERQIGFPNFFYKKSF